MRARSLIAAVTTAVLPVLSLVPSFASAQVTLRERNYTLAGCSTALDPVTGQPLVCGTATARSEQSFINGAPGFTLVGGRASFAIGQPFTWVVTGCGPVSVGPALPDCDVGQITTCADTICAAGPSSWFFSAGSTPPFVYNLERLTTFVVLVDPNVQPVGSMFDPALGGFQSVRVQLVVTPEPSTWALLGAGLLVVGGVVRRRRA